MSVPHISKIMPTIHIIDNKKISMTSHEWEMYESICKSYDRQSFKGEDLFKDLFESDEEGLITFIKAPSSKYTSMEVYLFICSLFQHQHVRKGYELIKGLMNEVREKLKEVK